MKIKLGINYGGVQGSAIYIYMDYAFPTRRLEDLYKHMKNKFQEEEQIINLNNTIVTNVSDSGELIGHLRRSDDLCRSAARTERPIKLIIVDSIASLFRSQFQYTKDGMIKRSHYLKEVGRLLRSLAEKYNLAAVVTNQVTDYFQENLITTTAQNRPMITSGRRVQPSLGLTWSQCVNTRIFMKRVSTSGSLRALEMVYSSPSAASSTTTDCHFSIEKEGLIDT